MYAVKFEFTRGDGKWRKSSTALMARGEAFRIAAAKRARPERYRSVKVMRLEDENRHKTARAWVEVG